MSDHQPSALVIRILSQPLAERGPVTHEGQDYEVLFMFQRRDGRYEHHLLPLVG